MSGAIIEKNDLLQDQSVQVTVSQKCERVDESLRWLKENMHPYFLLSMQKEVEALAMLAYGLFGMRNNRRMILSDRKNKLILAGLSSIDSFYESLQTVLDQPISFVEFTDSKVKLPGTEQYLEVYKYEFDRKKHSEIAAAESPQIPDEVKENVTAAIKQYYPQFDFSQTEKLLGILWLNNCDYVLNSSLRRVAKTLWLYQQTICHDGIFVDLQPADDVEGFEKESRLFFGVGNPPVNNFLSQVMEIFKRLNATVERAYGLTISNGIHPYFLATFYVTGADGQQIAKGSDLYNRLKEELYNTQILRSSSQTYRELIPTGLASGTDASVLSAFIGFCHTNMAHNHPDSYDLEGVMRAFHNQPDIALQLAIKY